MSRRGKESGGGAGHGSNWLTTYGDLVTLLMALFLMLYAISNIDAEKWKILAQAFNESSVSAEKTNQSNSTPSTGQSESTTGTTGEAVTEVTNFNQLYDYVNQYVQSNGLSSTVQVYDGDGYTFITFQNSTFFDGDSSVLKNEGKVILDYLAQGLVNIPDQIGEMRFYGHTAQTWEDVQGIPEAVAFDRQLSADRATSVLLYIQFKNIIDPGKLVAEGYGQYRPAVPHDGTEATRIINRRVEIYIVEQGAEEKSLEEIYNEINATKDTTGSE